MIKIKYISKNRFYQKLIPQGIVLHETATPGATANDEYNYFNNGDRGASAHAFVDWEECIQTIPYDEVAWHAGPSANHRYIGIEMCRPASHNPEQFKKVWDNTIDLFVSLLSFYGLSVDNITSHHAISLKWRETDHTDPTAYLKEYGKTFEDFKNEIKSKMEGDLTVTQYEELKKEVDELKQRLATYTYIDDNTAKIAPDANNALRAAVDKGVLAYGENGFEPGLSKDSIRIIIYMHRLNMLK